MATETFGEARGKRERSDELAESRKEFFDDEDELLTGELAGPAPRGFAPGELVACEACARSNAPTRMSCIYCGAALPATAESERLRRPVLRPLEGWERGLNVVLMPERRAEVTREEVAEAAAFLKMDGARLWEMTTARLALPVARASGEEEAALVERRLASLGFTVEIFADELLAAEASRPVQVRKLELGEESVKGWAAGEASRELRWPDVVLIASGRIFTRRVEVEERSALARRTDDVVETRETMADTPALEIYARGEAAGWRVTADGFDYSCLGAAKGLLARENFVRLAEALRGRAASAVYDDEYGRVRHLLAHAWPLAEHTESGGLRRARPGKFNTESVTVLTNDAQFTRYARLRYHLELRRRGREGAA